MTSKYLNRNIAQFQESVIRQMSRICAEVKGINLAQGFPDHDPVASIKEAAKLAIDEGYNQYAVTWGEPSFRQAIAKKSFAYNRIPTDADRHVTVTCGATEAMMCALLSIIEPGDEVVIFEPFYENYGPDCVISGAKPVFVPLIEKDGRFQFSETDLRAAFNERTKALILNTPGNPCGKVFTRAELDIIAKLCIEFDALVITDEIYEHILYHGHEHVSIASLPGMFERSITISGCSKTYSVTGWRLAYLIAPEEITLGLRKIHDFLTVGAPHPLQRAGTFMLEQSHEFYQDLKRGFDERRKLLLDILKSCGFQCSDPEGAYYILADVGHWFGKTLKNDVDFAMWLAREIGIAAVPGSSFYKHGKLGAQRIRFTFSKKPETLEQAAERLRKMRDKLPA